MISHNEAQALISARQDQLLDPIAEHELSAHLATCDSCRAFARSTEALTQGLRTLPYMIAWHERYARAGLLVIGVHAAGFPPSEDPDAVAAAVERLGIPYPVIVDAGLEVWSEYDNLGWPARYLFGPDNMLFEYHFGEGGYAETERAIQELLADRIAPLPLLDPVRPGDAPEAPLVVQSDDRPGAFSGAYEAGEETA